MLRDLHIRNLAVLEEAAIAVSSGFNVLSGETGAGKSIVVDSLALLSGVRASSELIRTGADALTVTGVFEPQVSGWREILDGAGVAGDDDTLVIRREISRSGRNRVFVNDQPVTLKLLLSLAPYLLRIHGQREELGLVDPELQRQWLDRCGGDEAAALLNRTVEAYRGYRDAASRLERLTGDERTRQERLDFIRFQLSEIDAAAMEEDEELGLRQEREILRHSEAIESSLAETCELLFDRDDAAYGALNRALQLCDNVAAWEPQAAEWRSELDDLCIRLAEMDRAMHHRLDSLDREPGRLDSLEDRLAVLERLFRKHGPSSREVLQRRQELWQESQELSADEATLTEVKAQLEGALRDYREAADALSEGRRRWARELEQSVRGDLAELALAKARFQVRLDLRRRADSPLQISGQGVEITRQGYDAVIFEFSSNPGEELRPLSKVASGGELSRLYLAVQLAARSVDGSSGGASTLVFDEVDAGISGAEAAVLGSKLQRLARGAQVLAVTHLPQVASYGDAHFKVSKDVRSGRTHTRIQQLEEQGRIEEVARMLAGNEVTELSLSHARELIAGAHGHRSAP